MKKGLNITGCVLWIAGFVMTIVGLNIQGSTGQWVSVIGNILFLVGLGLVGIVWFKNRREKPEEKKTKPDEPETDENEKETT